MLAITIIVLRELLEVSIILGMLYTLLKDTGKAISTIGYGFLGGVLCSIIITAGFFKVSSFFTGQGQEFLNIFIISASIFFLFYTVLTIRKHSADLKNKIILSKDANLSAPIILLTALTISREGAELSLFLYSSYLNGASYTELLQGVTFGAGIAAIISVGIYGGLLKLPTKTLFNFVNIMLSLFAASLAAELASYFSEMGFLESLSSAIWNTSWIIKQESITGKLLKTFVGYNANPTYLQVIFYILTLGFMLKVVKYKK